MDRRHFLGQAAAGAVGLVAGSTLAVAAQQLPAAAAVLGDDREALAAAHLGSTVHTPYGVRQIVWSGPTGSGQVGLTFDDGPDPAFTPRILDALATAGVHATFCVMGWNAARHPDLLREIVAAGHELANHTQTHRDLADADAGAVRAQLMRARSVVEQVAQRPMRFFRPPRGELTGCATRVAASLGYDILLWSATRGSYDTNDTTTVGGQITAGVHAGDVLLLHDGIGRGTFDRDGSAARQLSAQREAEVRALPAVLRRVADERGLRFVTASALVPSVG